MGGGVRPDVVCVFFSFFSLFFDFFLLPVLTNPPTLCIALV